MRSYGEHEITVTIEDGVVTGRLPRRAQALVLEWLSLHRDELRANWERARTGQPLVPVPPRVAFEEAFRATEVGLMLHVRSVEYRGAHRLHLTFTDGAEGEVDLAHYLEGEVFAPLRDPGVFAMVYLHPELRTIAWPNGADFAPEFLRELLKSGVAAA